MSSTVSSDPVRPVHEVGGYREYAPPPDLAEVAAVLWTHAARTPAGTTPHRVVPEPDVSVAYVSRETADGMEPDGLYLVGPVRAARYYDPEPGVQMHAVRLYPEWCRPLLGAHPEEHGDAMVDLVRIRPALAGPLLDDLSSGTTAREILHRLAGAVRGWAGRAGLVPASDLTHQRLQRLRAAGPTVRLEAICRDWAVSTRHLRRTVRAATGTSPKRMLRLKRLAGALFRADGSADPDWTRIALDCGYYDQSHLIRDCRELVGAPPGTLHRERRIQPRSA